jgi:AmpE protein
MKLLIVVLCVLMERYGNIAPTFRRFDWLDSWEHFLKRKLPTLHPIPIFAATIALPLFAVYVLCCVLGGLFWGGLGVLFEAAILFYCLGPTNLFHGHAERGNKAAQRYFSAANRECCGLIFWYLAFGILGAALYRLVDRLSAEQHPNPAAELCMKYIDWVPARLTAILYLLVGNLQPAFPFVIANGWSSADKNDFFLVECGLYAAKQGSEKTVSLAEARQLVWYALILRMVIIALFTLAVWL